MNSEIKSQSKFGWVTTDAMLQSVRAKYIAENKFGFALRSVEAEIARRAKK